MKRAAEHAQSAPILPPPTNHFPIESPLHAAYEKLLHDKTTSKRDDKTSKPTAPKSAFNADPSPQNTDLFAYTNALLYRITGRYLPASVVGDGTTQAAEVAHIQTDRELLTVIESVKEISHQFHEAAQLVLAHRRELGKLLLKLETTYLGVFEKLLAATMRFYYKYRQDHVEERHQQRRNTLALNTKIEELEESIRVLTHHIEAKESLIKSNRIKLRDLEQENASLRKNEEDAQAMQIEYRELKLYRLDFEKREEQIRKREETLSRKQEQLDVRARMLENHHKAEQSRRAEHARTMKEQIQKQFFESQSPEGELDDGTPTDETFVRITVETTTSATQTEVDDDGLWDIKDGVPKCVSKDARIRMHWRRFDAFVKCKNCHGRPKTSDVDKAYNELWDVKTRRKRWQMTAASEWTVPAVIEQFLTHLPRSALGLKYYSLPVVISRIEDIYDAKLVADCSDEDDGIAYEDLNQFVASFYLKICSGRQKAEIELYRLLISVKSLYRGSSMIRMFARFMHLLQPLPPTITPAAHPPVMADNADDDKADKDKKKATMSKREMDCVGLSKQSYLNQSYLRVYLHARHRALHHPTAGTSHIICVDDVKKWLPLEYAIEVLRWYLSYLPEEKLRAYCRQLEYNTAIYAGGVVSEPTGRRLTVRAHMRQSMLATGHNQPNPNENEKKYDAIVVVNVYLLLELIMDVLQLRNKEIDDELIALFAAGDQNNDKVLSFTEFCSILAPRVPHYNARRLLRMFREAVMASHSDANKPSFVISIATFIDVCTRHGLVSLIESDKLPCPFKVGHLSPAFVVVSNSNNNSHPPTKAKRRKTTRSAAQQADTKSKEQSPPRRSTTLPRETSHPQMSSRISRKDAQASASAALTSETGVQIIAVEGSKSNLSKSRTHQEEEIEEDIPSIVEEYLASPRTRLLETSYDDGEDIQEEINMMLDFV
ncbi:hypothetical protein Ae201684P_005143 [Aphanomyces euteiches]|nr:hypothetical protein Ae201684P_005143 [Aphanomyces euteiches]